MHLDISLPVVTHWPSHRLSVISKWLFTTSEPQTDIPEGLLDNKPFTDCNFIRSTIHCQELVHWVLGKQCNTASDTASTAVSL